jgi:hypothetical protein
MEGNCVANDGASTWVIGASNPQELLVSTDDAVTWTPLGVGVINSVRGVAYNGVDRWVAVGFAGGAGANTIAVSSDGVTWNGLGDIMFTTYGDDVAYGNGVWIAAGSGSTGGIARSTNGLSWTQVGAAAGTSMTGVAYDGTSKWLVGGTNTIVSSTDNGVTWSAVASAPSDVDVDINQHYSLAWATDRWLVGTNSSVATSATSSRVWYSMDGDSWLPCNNPAVLAGFPAVSSPGVTTIAAKVQLPV